MADALSAEIRQLITNLKDTVTAVAGIGLAAPQIGSAHRVCVVNYPDKKSPSALINPEVAWISKGTSVLEEACLSIPNVVVPVRRPKKVRVRALDEKGKPVELSATDLLAKILQHEIDHLNGVLITDYQHQSESGKA